MVSKYMSHSRAFYILPEMFSMESDLPLAIKQKSGNGIREPGLPFPSKVGHLQGLLKAHRPADPGRQFLH